MSCLGLRVAGRSGDPLDRKAEPLVEPEIGATRRQRPDDLLPPRRSPALEIGVSEKAVDRHRPEPLRRVEHNDRRVPREERRERWRRTLSPTGNGHNREPRQRDERHETLEKRHTLKYPC